MDKSEQHNDTEIEMWCLEYSKNQDSFHISEIEQCFHRILKWVNNDTYETDDWKIVYFGSYDEVCKALDILKYRFRKQNVYLVAADGTNLIKIGYTEGDIKDRIKQLQTGCPYKIYLVDAVTVRDGIKFESELHEKMLKYKKNGEWYCIPDLESSDYLFGFLGDGFVGKMRPKNFTNWQWDRFDSYFENKG